MPILNGTLFRCAVGYWDRPSCLRAGATVRS